MKKHHQHQMALRKKTVNWLTTLDLENLIRKYADKKTNKAFLGIFPLDKLPQKLPYLPVLFIINTNTSNLPGQHWKAVYVSSNGNGDLFDSLATSVSLRLQKWMNTFTKNWTTSKLTLQNPLAPSCGGYVLYYVLERFKHKSMYSCISKFTSNVIENERIVENYFKRFM